MLVVVVVVFLFVCFVWFLIRWLFCLFIQSLLYVVHFVVVAAAVVVVVAVIS